MIPETGPGRPDFYLLAAAANAAFEKLSPVDKALHRIDQRRSWVRGEMGLEHPELSEGHLNELVRLDPGVVLAQEVRRLREALTRIAKWHGEFPPSGKFWDDGSPMSYAAAFGSNGERDFMRGVARTALDRE